MRALICLSLLLVTWLPQALAAPAFYQLEKAGKTHWLLGSIHIGDDSLYPLPPAVEKGWQAASSLVLETSLSVSAQELSEIRKLTHLQQGTLAEELSPKLYQRTVAAAERLGISAQTLSPLTPWYGSILLTQAALKKAGFSSSQGIDQHFEKRAKRAKKPVIGLESASQQLNYLASLGESQLLLLENSLNELPEIRLNTKKVLNAWQKGNEKQLMFLLKTEQAPPELARWLTVTLLGERNLDWLEKWPGLPDKSFIVVGALHLYEPQGLLAGLEKAGWKVTRLTH
ncbi:MAG: TraB/GumN family protein [Aeromonas sp.]